MVPVDLETLFGVLFALPQILGYVLKMYAPMVHSYYFKKRHVQVEGSAMGILCLNIYFFVSAAIAREWLC